LKSSKYALLVFNPFLVGAFRRVFEAQLLEFTRLFGRSPSHFDGHQHMHLSSNMLLQTVIPAEAKVRRSFSFRAGEKTPVNRLYRRFVDSRLARSYRLTDFFFALASNLEPGKLAGLFALSQETKVELMTHAWNKPEFDCLMSQEFLRLSERSLVGNYAQL
jgi:predicted glycoside hydrolase/deacetylase ChbG (UPF0249 family)